MGLMERVAALVRANLNDLIDKAEDPEAMLKQVILDMENQQMQVKTQVAMAVADDHLLQRKKQENEEKRTEWMHKAEKAVARKDDALARAALERAEACRTFASALDEQIAEHAAQTESLRAALRTLEQKLSDARGRFDLLVTRNRRARATQKAAAAGLAATSEANEAKFDRMRRKVQVDEVIGAVASEMAATQSVDDRFAAMDREERIEALLEELKRRA